MEGYMTMADEALEQMEALGFDNPSTHIFAGRGGRYGRCCAGLSSNRFKEDLGKTIIMEADTSACIYKSALGGWKDLQSFRIWIPLWQDWPVVSLVLLAGRC